MIYLKSWYTMRCIIWPWTSLHEVSITIATYDFYESHPKGLSPMLLAIWLVPCHKVPSSNSLELGTLVCINAFTRDAIHQCGEASLGFPCDVFLWKKWSLWKFYLCCEYGSLKSFKNNGFFHEEMRISMWSKFVVMRSHYQRVAALFSVSG